MLISSTTGTALSGLFSKRYGRKRTLIGGHVVMLIGWVAKAQAPSFAVVLLGRVLMGLASGVNLATSFLLLSELALVRLRGAFGTLNVLLINLGMLLGHVLGAATPFHYVVPGTAQTN